MYKLEAIEKTIAMLREYQDMDRRIKALRWEMLHPQNVTKDEIIGQMTMPGASDTVGAAAAGRISDKTMYIALNYEQRFTLLNEEENARVTEELYPLEMKAERLEFYVGLLPPRLSQAIRLHYFQGLSWKDAAHAEAVTTKAMEKRRTAAVTMLAELMFRREITGE